MSRKRLNAAQVRDLLLESSSDDNIASNDDSSSGPVSETSADSDSSVAQAGRSVKQVQIQIPLLLLTLCRILDMTIGVQEEFVVQVEFVVVGDVVEGVVEDREQRQSNDHDLHIGHLPTKYHKSGT